MSGRELTEILEQWPERLADSQLVYNIINRFMTTNPLSSTKEYKRTDSHKRYNKEARHLRYLKAKAAAAGGRP